MQKPENTYLPKSLKEARELGQNLYYTGTPCKYGHLTYRYVADRACAACVKAKVKKASTTGGGNKRRWAAKTAEQKATIYAKRKAYYETTKEARKAEKLRSYHRLKQDSDWLAVRRSKVNEHRKTKGRTKEVSNPEVKRRYKQTQKGKAATRANDAKRRAAKMQRTPTWLTVDDH